MNAESFRDLFQNALTAESERGETYLANHSLGRPPDTMPANVARGVSSWTSQMDRAWEGPHWMAEIQKFRGLVAQLVGSSRPDCVVPKTSAGQGLRAVLNSFPASQTIEVVTTTGEFDSIDFILKTYQYLGRARVRFCEPTGSCGPVPMFEATAILDLISASTDVVVLSAVWFTTGQILEGLEEIVRKAHQHGALVILDAYHALGVIPFDLEASGVDFVIGGCYKYLRGGPGACFLVVHPRHIDHHNLRTLDTGWFAKKNTFSYERTLVPELETGGDSWLESTPPVLTAYQSTPGLEFTLSVGIDQIRSQSLQIQEAVRACLRSAGYDVFEPKDPTKFGAFSLVSSDRAKELCKSVVSQKVIVDTRGHFVRFGPDILTGESDLKAVEALKP